MSPIQLVRDRSALSEPYCQSTCLSAGCHSVVLSFCLSVCSHFQNASSPVVLVGLSWYFNTRWRLAAVLEISWRYLWNGSSDQLRVWYLGRVFGDSGSNGSISGWTKSKRRSPAILENFEWPYLCNGLSDPLSWIREQRWRNIGENKQVSPVQYNILVTCDSANANKVRPTCDQFQI